MMAQITSRERLLAAGLIAVVAVWALYSLAVRPACDRVRTLQRTIPEKQVQLRDLQALSARYTVLRNNFTQLRETLASQEPDFQLLPFLETKIERHQLARHVVTMQPDLLQPQPDYSEVVVTIELHDISLKQLVNFLSDVETSESVVRVGSLHVRKDPHNEARLDSTVGIHSPRLSRPALTAQAAQ
jgi:type II secretory pathway component PulM